MKLNLLNLFRPMYWIGAFMSAALSAFALSLVWQPLSYAFYPVGALMLVVGLFIDYDEKR